MHTLRTCSPDVEGEGAREVNNDKQERPDQWQFPNCARSRGDASDFEPRVNL